MPYPFVSNWCREGEQYLRYSDILSVCVTVSPIAPFSAKWVVHWGGEIGWLGEDGKNLKTFSSASKAKEAADERLRQLGYKSSDLQSRRKV